MVFLCSFILCKAKAFFYFTLKKCMFKRSSIKFYAYFLLSCYEPSINDTIIKKYFQYAFEKYPQFKIENSFPTIQNSKSNFIAYFEILYQQIGLYLRHIIIRFFSKGGKKCSLILDVLFLKQLKSVYYSLCELFKKLLARLLLQ